LTTIAPSDVPAGIGHNQPPGPTLADILKERFGPAFELAEKIANEANGHPQKIADPAAKEAAIETAAKAAKLFKEVDNTRKEVKAPFKEAVDAIDGHCRDPLARLKRIDEVLMSRVTAYDRAVIAQQREAERLAQEEARRREEAAREEAEQAAKAGRMEDAIAALDDANAAATDRAMTIAEAPTAADATRVQTAGGTMASAGTEWTFEVTDRAKIDLNMLRDFIAPDDVDAALKRFVKINKGTKEIPGVRVFEDVKTRRRRS